MAWGIMAWTKSLIVGEVQKRTENRVANKMDLNMEFFLALDQLCNEQHFWWRKRRAKIATVIGQATPYDISTVAPDFVELETALLMNADGVTVQRELTHITDPGHQLEMLLNNVRDTPSNVFVDTQTSYQNLCFQAPASVAQLVYFMYYAMPMVTDLTQDKIPLLPPWLHYGMISALERRVYLVLFGNEDPRYETTNEEYQEFLEAANNTPSWTSKKVTEARTTRSYARIVTAHGPGSSGRVIPQG
jgi:hypothetical protein